MRWVHVVQEWLFNCFGRQEMKLKCTIVFEAAHTLTVWPLWGRVCVRICFCDRSSMRFWRLWDQWALGGVPLYGNGEAAIGYKEVTCFLMVHSRPDKTLTGSHWPPKKTRLMGWVSGFLSREKFITAILIRTILFTVQFWLNLQRTMKYRDLLQIWV